MPLHVTSSQNPRVKSAARLRDRRHRQRDGRFLIDGTRELARALAAGIEIVEIFLRESVDRDPRVAPLLAHRGAAGATVITTTDEVFAKLAYGQRAEGIVAAAVTPRHTLDEITLSGTPLVAVLEQVEKPGNVGAVFRSADGVGLAAVLLADPVTDLYNPNTVRASLGTVFTMPRACATSSEILAWLQQRQFQIVAAHVDAEVAYTAVDYTLPTALVFGSEAAGLSSAWSGAKVRGVSLPMHGAADSLNVATAAAVMFYEALRQRSV